MAVVVCLVSSVALLTGSSPESTMTRPFRVIQMNLCDSGMAGCYTGRSVAAAAAVIRNEAPDLVTLNEVCQQDVSALDRAMAARYPGSAVVSAFTAAGDRRTGGAYHCLNGQPYGIGLVARLANRDGRHTMYSGLYPAQDTRDPEERAWLCVYAPADFYACTTHLADTSASVALTQCSYLLRTAIPTIRDRGGYEPTVLGGDLNLRYRGSPDVRSCVPSGYLRDDDGGVQQIVATAEFVLSSRRSIGMDGTTDHPGLLVALTIPRTG
ncbi:endonuclease/exonuclease/phosphatase family protein [Planosporangium thailandense]|uniref:Endonuclease/exonuclease/phosphatase family protein n=1 Tax=Planosporangium thailandense TaxID=765197 RepID=A0ABX0Y983_9ACTN|nr:endonuclease/exonuclease/phosphatase family protein [Planosporangium thailandense]